MKKLGKKMAVASHNIANYSHCYYVRCQCMDVDMTSSTYIIVTA